MAELSPSGMKRRILFVDDDLSFGRSLERDLRTRSFEIETAGTAAEAISRVAVSPPDVVVLDLYLPDGAALQLLKLWKTQMPGLAVIIVSGDASLTTVVNALKEGARGFFTKPVDAAALISELDESRTRPPRDVSPALAASHQLSTAGLKTEGVDRFFAISPGLLAIAGFDGYFKMLNPEWEKVLGYSVDELCSKPYVELVHPDDRERATDQALEITGGHTVFRYTNRYCCKDGSYRWLAWSATPSPAHRLIYASARDVTKSVRMEQGLREANERLKEVVEIREVLLRESTVKNVTLSELGRFKDEIAAMIVHDLKSPLSVIVSNYEYLLEGFEGSPGCLEALEDSRNAGRRMLRLLANLIDVARLEAGTLEVCAAKIDLTHLLQPIVDQRRVLTRSRKISIVIAHCPELTVMVDADLITRAFENIFDNALRHTPEGGRIEIEVRDDGADAEIRIGNSGYPIPVGARDTIFEKYRQVGGIGRMNLGLGLYFCRLAIEAHGGRIWIEETALLPTVFAIRLPRLATLPARLALTERAGAST